MRYQVYARYSSEGQCPLSCDQQIAECRAWAARQSGWEERGEPLSDAATSGYKNRSRAGLDRLIEVVESGALDGGVILVWSTSRLARDFAWLVPTFIDLHDRHNVNVADCKVGIFDLSTTQGRVMLPLMASMDQDYSEEISRNTKRGLRDLAAAGYWTGRHVPYGTTLEHDGTGHLLVRGPNWPHLERIFRLRPEVPLAQIAKTYNAEGVPSQYGGRWIGSTIRHITRNPAYVGWANATGGTRPLLSGALLDPDLWARAQVRVDSGSRRAPSRSPLRGMVFCAGCKRAAWRTGWDYLRCRSYADGEVCPAPGLGRGSVLMPEIWAALDKRAADGRLDLRARLASTQQSAGEAALIVELDQLRASEARLAEAIATVPDSTALQAQIAHVAARRGDVERLLRDGQSGAADTALAEKLTLREGSTLRKLVKKVEVAQKNDGFARVWLVGGNPNRPIKLRAF